MTSSDSSRVRGSRAHWWAALASGLLLALTAWHAADLSTPGLVDRTGRLKGPDFLQFYTYGALARRGATDQLYEPAAHVQEARRIDPGLSLIDFRPNYPPIVAWLFVPLATRPFLEAMVWFWAATVAIYLAAIGVVGSSTIAIRRQAGALLLTALAYPALFATIRYGQLSSLTLLLVSGAAAMSARNRPFLAGILLGLVAYKPQLLVVPCLALLVSRERSLLGGLLCGVVVETLLNLAIGGPGLMLQYASALIELARRPELVQLYAAESHSAGGLIRLLTGVGPLATAFGWLSVPAAAWAVWRVWRQHADWRPRWAALVVGALVASPHLLTYDLLLLAVPLVLSMDWVLSTTDDVPAGAWRWVLAGLYFGAWPGTLIARIYLVQPSTLAMVALLALLARPVRATPA